MVRVAPRVRRGLSLEAVFIENPRWVCPSRDETAVGDIAIVGP